jgi:hypothetical protein
MDAGAAAIVLVGAMCAVSIYGAIRIPHDARWPVRFGGFGHQTNMGRVTGLVMWPLLGLAVGSLVWWEVGSTAALALIGLVVMLLAQLATVLRLARG